MEKTVSSFYEMYGLYPTNKLIQTFINYKFDDYGMRLWWEGGGKQGGDGVDMSSLVGVSYIG